MRDPVGPLVDLCIGQGDVLEDHRRRVRGAPHLPLEGGRDGGAGRQLQAGNAGIDRRDQAALRDGEQLDVADPAARVGDGALQRVHQVAGEALDRRPVEEGGGVLDLTVQPVRALLDLDREVELGHPPGQLDPAHLEAGQVERAVRGVHHGKGDLEQRGA